MWLWRRKAVAQYRGWRRGWLAAGAVTCCQREARKLKKSQPEEGGSHWYRESVSLCEMIPVASETMQYIWLK